MWFFMLAMDMLVPLSMVGLGRRFLKKVPEKINAVFGYRTEMSMKNDDTWSFAHNYCGKVWFYGGIVLIPISVIVMLFIIGKSINTISIAGCIVCFAQIILFVMTIIPTEAALKRTFDRNGNRR